MRSSAPTGTGHSHGILSATNGHIPLMDRRNFAYVDMDTLKNSK